MAYYDAGGKIKELEYDVLGRLIRTTEPGGSQRRMEYDPDGHLVRLTDANGGVTEIAYSPYGDYLLKVDPLGYRQTFKWDSEARLIEVVNAKGEVAEFANDSEGHVTEVRHFDGRIESNVFDLAGRLTRHVMSNGVVMEYDYDPVGNLLKISADHRQILTNKYDLPNPVIETVTPDRTIVVDRDKCGRVVAENQGEQRVEYVYDSLGKVVRRTFSASRCKPIEFDYDKRGRLTAIGTHRDPVQRFFYDTRDFLVRRSMGVATEFLGLDTWGRLIQQSVRNHWGTQIVARRYVYDAESQVLLIDDARKGACPIPL